MKKGFRKLFTGRKKKGEIEEQPTAALPFSSTDNPPSFSAAENHFKRSFSPKRDRQEVAPFSQSSSNSNNNSGSFSGVTGNQAESVEQETQAPLPVALSNNSENNQAMIGRDLITPTGNIGTEQAPGNGINGILSASMGNSIEGVDAQPNAIEEIPDVIKSYEQVPLLEQTKLPRGGLSMETEAVGRVQVRTSNRRNDLD